jgi:predicted Zn finger-like uncharacterized protein
MALGTRCPNCHALFRVAADQLKLRGGLVRCGACQHVFDAIGTLNYIDDATLPAATQPPSPAVDAVIAAIRKAESAAGDAMSMHDASAPTPARPTLDSDAAPKQVAILTKEGEPDATFGAVPDSDQRSIAFDAAPQEAVPESERAVESAAPIGDMQAVLAEQVETEPIAADERPTVAGAAEPAFLRQARTPGRRRISILFGGAAILLGLLLLAQLAVTFRADILTKCPNARPALGQLCKIFRCTVSWPTRGDLLAVVGSELQALPGTSVFELTAIVRNRGNLTLALPALELTLSDTLNRTVARKVFVPGDYLATETDPQAALQAGIEAGADLTIRVAFEARDLNASGFIVYPFYL